MVKSETQYPLEDRVENIFSFKGRIKRSTFWPWYVFTNPFLWTLFVGFIGGTLVHNSLLQGSAPEWINLIVSISGLLILLLMSWVCLALHIQRLHDRNRSGWWLVTLFIPLIGIFYAIWLIIEIWFLRGSIGPNRYGPDFRKYKIYCPECSIKRKVLYDMIGNESVCHGCKTEFTIKHEWLGLGAELNQ